MSPTTKKTELEAKRAALEAELRALGRPELLGYGLRRIPERRAAQMAWDRENPERAGQTRALLVELDRIERALTKADALERVEAGLLTRLRAAGVGTKDATQALRLDRERVTAAIHAERWLANKAAWGLLLSGPPGNGKTTAAAWTMAESLRRGGGRVCFRRQAFFTEPERIRRELWELRGAELLVLDEVGGHPPLHPSQLGKLIELIEERRQEGARTLITTNLAPVAPETGGPSPLAEFIGGRTFDRFRDGMVMIACLEPSFRGRG